MIKMIFHNLKLFVEYRKKIVIFLVLAMAGLGTLGVSLVPVMNYMTGEDLSKNAKFIIPAVYIGLYATFSAVVIFIIIALTVMSKKLYIVKKIEESIKGIKKGKLLDSNTVPGREELLQSHFAERIHASGLNTSKLKIFDHVTDEERHQIIGFKIEEKQTRSSVKNSNSIS